MASRIRFYTAKKEFPTTVAWKFKWLFWPACGMDAIISVMLSLGDGHEWYDGLEKINR